MTTIASTTVNIEGFRGQYTSYAIEVRNPKVDGDTVSVDVHTGNRDGDSAIVEEANYVLHADGSEIDRKEGANFNNSSSSVSRAVTLSGEADTSSGTLPMSLELTFPAWSGSETLDFEVDIEPEVSESDLLVSCSRKPAEVTVGERVTIIATVENTAEADANVDIVVELAGATDEMTETVSAGETIEREVQFEMEEEGEYESEVRVSLDE